VAGGEGKPIKSGENEDRKREKRGMGGGRRGVKKKKAQDERGKGQGIVVAVVLIRRVNSVR